MSNLAAAVLCFLIGLLIHLRLQSNVQCLQQATKSTSVWNAHGGSKGYQEWLVNLRWSKRMSSSRSFREKKKVKNPKEISVPQQQCMQEWQKVDTAFVPM